MLTELIMWDFHSAFRTEEAIWMRGEMPLSCKNKSDIDNTLDAGRVTVQVSLYVLWPHAGVLKHFVHWSEPSH